MSTATIVVPMIPRIALIPQSTVLHRFEFPPTSLLAADARTSFFLICWTKKDEAVPLTGGAGPGEQASNI